jgi:hypothetical protein
MAPNRELFTQVIDLFGVEQEDIRLAAAFAAGLL